MTLLKVSALVVALLVPNLAASGAMATSEHHHGAKHGGQFVELKGHQGVEMVVKGNAITFFVTEEDKPAHLEGGSFRVVVQAGSSVKMYPLKVDGSTLKVQLDSVLPRGAKIVITGKDGHGHTLQARFVKN